MRFLPRRLNHALDARYKAPASRRLNDTPARLALRYELVSRGRSRDQRGFVGFLFHYGIAVVIQPSQKAVCLRPICPGKGPRDGISDIELVLHVEKSLYWNATTINSNACSELKSAYI
jgi:hypothetical protein